MSKVLLLLVVPLLVIVVFLSLRAFSGDEDTWICSEGQWVKHGNPSAPQPSETCPSAETTDKPSSANIVLESPQEGDQIGNPVIIKGSARVFENQLNYRISDKSGKTLKEGSIMADAKEAGEFGPFEVEVTYPVSSQTEGIVEVFDYSAKDGSQIDTVSVDVILGKANTTQVKVYFSKQGEDECEKVSYVTRTIDKTPTIGKAAIEELLKGPTSQERVQGYQTSINSGVILEKLTIDKGVARAEFNNQLEESVGGSCRVAAIRAQIVHTLKQFPTVVEVVILIDGRSEDILQP